MSGLIVPKEDELQKPSDCVQYKERPALLHLLSSIPGFLSRSIAFLLGPGAYY